VPLPKWDDWSCWCSSLRGSTLVLPPRSIRSYWSPLDMAITSHTICQARGLFYAAIDQKASVYARSLGVFTLRMILRPLWTQHILRQEEVRALIQQLWEKDKLGMVNPEEIFRE
jgi:hypothetical protein